MNIQLLALIFCAIFLQKFAHANSWSAPYTFEELIEKNLINVDSAANPLFKDSKDYRLAFDYDFSLGDNEKIVINDRDDAYWNAEMAEARNAIKDARIRQRDTYRKFGQSLFQDDDDDKDDDENIQIARAEIEEDDDTITYYYTVCTDLESESYSRSDDSSDDDIPSLIPREFRKYLNH